MSRSGWSRGALLEKEGGGGVRSKSRIGFPMRVPTRTPFFYRS